MSKNFLFAVLCLLTFVPLLQGMPFEINLVPFLAMTFILHVGAVGLAWRTFDKLIEINGSLSSVFVLALSFVLYFLAAMIVEKSFAIPKLFVPLILLHGSMVLWCSVYLMEKILKLRIKIRIRVKINKKNSIE